MADKNYEKHTWTVSEFQKGDQKFIDNLNHMEDGIGGVSDKYVKEAVVDNDRATIEFTDQDGNKTTYYPITAESGTTKAYVDDGDASVTVTPLSSLIGVEYEEDEVRGFRIGDPSGTHGTGISYKIRETARAEEIPAEVLVPEAGKGLSWGKFVDNWNTLVSSTAGAFRGRTYSGKVTFVYDSTVVSEHPERNFPGISHTSTEAQRTFAISCFIPTEDSAVLTIRSMTVSPYEWEIGTMVNGTPNYSPLALVTAEDSVRQRSYQVDKEVVFRNNLDGSFEQLWRPALHHVGDGMTMSYDIKSLRASFLGVAIIECYLLAVRISRGTTPTLTFNLPGGTDGAGIKTEIPYNDYEGSDPTPTYTNINGVMGGNAYRVAFWYRLDESKFKIRVQRNAGGGLWSTSGEFALILHQRDGTPE